ncbi:ATP-dependent DNA helicase PIF1-like protein [Tanacetum coccineum]|uniref:ATP-dependent DNA helicase n=1 Tax=Tanacetum coccineum TaxID=301880 RepID=A0ABQ5BUA4_9ASTR
MLHPGLRQRTDRGRTPHITSRFKIPTLIIHRTQFATSKKQSRQKTKCLAKLLCQAKLIIWDEASMAKRQVVEAVYQTMQDITGVKLLFGGKILALGGDFRQVLPVVRHFRVKRKYTIVMMNQKTTRTTSKEFLNSLNISGLPPHYLRLKIGCPIILLINLNPENRLCNGTRLICKRLDPNVINAEIATGQHARVRVLLPRIPLAPSKEDMFPFKLKRTQFPSRLTLDDYNKLKGKQCPNVGVYLPRSDFLPHSLAWPAIKLLCLKESRTTIPESPEHPELMLIQVAGSLVAQRLKANVVFIFIGWILPCVKELMLNKKPTGFVKGEELDGAEHDGACASK